MCVCLVLYFICFVIGDDSLATNEDIMRFKSRGGEVLYPSLHIFLVKIFHFV